MPEHSTSTFLLRIGERPLMVRVPWVDPWVGTALGLPESGQMLTHVAAHPESCSSGSTCEVAATTYSIVYIYTYKIGRPL